MNSFTDLSSKSVKEQHYIQSLQNPKIKIVSFDIFETLAFRNVAKPHDIFDRIGNLQDLVSLFDDPTCFRNYRIQAEQKARKNLLINEEITLTEIYQNFPITPNHQQILMDLELATENNALFINQQIEQWIKLAIEHNKKVILISDMYLSKKHIQEMILSKLASPSMISDIFMSSEYKQTKASGNLYITIKNILGHNFDEQLHIGDNVHSDHRIPSNFGIHTCLYNLNSSLLEILTNEYSYNNMKLPKVNNQRILASMLNPYEGKSKEFFFNLGALIYGPLLWEFAHWLGKLTVRKGIQHVNFVMREGKILQKYFSKLYNTVDTKLIYASRASTYLISINQEELYEKGFNIFEYKNFTIGDFYRLFKIPIYDQIILKNQHVLCKDANLLRVNDDTLLNYFLQELHTHLSEIQTLIDEEKSKITSYLSNLEIHANSITIDFGGHGTILKRLSSVYKEFSTSFALFYIHQQGYEKLCGHNVSSFLKLTPQTEKKLTTIKRSPEVIEILLNGNDETTIGYESMDHKVFPLKGSSKSAVFEETDAFENGIDAFFEIAKIYNLSDNSFSNDELISMLSRMIELPTSSEVEFIGELPFDIGGGSSQKEKSLISPLNHLDYDNALKFYIGFLNNKNETKDSIPWVEGSIAKMYPNLISKFHGFLAPTTTEESINKILIELDNTTHDNIMIYGAGDFCKQLLPHLHQKNIIPISLLDARAGQGTFLFEGYSVCTLQERLKSQSTLILASGVFIQKMKDEILRVMKEKSLNNIRVISHHGLEIL